MNTARSPSSGEIPKYPHASAMIASPETLPPATNHDSGTSTPRVRASSSSLAPLRPSIIPLSARAITPPCSAKLVSP